MKFIDTCGVLLFINKKDALRPHYNLGNKPAEKCVAKNEKQFCIPMPALGEVVYKVYEKCGTDADNVLKELNNLIRKNFLKGNWSGPPPDPKRLVKSNFLITTTFLIF